MTHSVRKKKIHRVFPRRSASAKFKVTCQKKGIPEGEGNLASVVLDLSEAGARLLLTAALAVGEEVVVGLEGPAYPKPLKRPGKVVWCFQVAAGAYAVGVRLEEHLANNDIEQVTIAPVRLDY